MTKNNSGPFPPIHVLIPAAGSGTRTGQSIPKQFFPLCGKPILRHTLEKILSLEGLAAVQVVIGAGQEELYQSALGNLANHPLLRPPVTGGESRRDSVRCGLMALKKEGLDDMTLVLVHDAARPFVEPANIVELLETLASGQTNAATLAVSCADTLAYEDYTVEDRSKLRAIQTPQAFRFGILSKAHETFSADHNFTDDAGLVAALGERIAFVEGTRMNFKITTPDDLHMAERILSGLTETRTGFGYDVHAFDPAPALAIRLGGIDIPYSKKLLGHSDADVILHALTDAILGALGDGDIGQIFPPSNPQWKGADSSIFIAEALNRLNGRGGTLVHADITLLAEAPKIGPHRTAMLDRLSTLLSLPPSSIGLKATTMEKLGFIGREEGIAAQALVTVRLPTLGATAQV